MRWPALQLAEDTIELGLGTSVHRGARLPMARLPPHITPANSLAQLLGRLALQRPLDDEAERRRARCPLAAWLGVVV